MPTPPADLPLGVHCWLHGPVDATDPTTRRAALLVEWRLQDAAWWARVMYVANLRPGRDGVVEEWVPGAQVLPA